MPPKNAPDLSGLVVVGQLGLVMIACIAGGLLAGMYLDRLLGTRPVLAIVLMLGGVAAGMVAVYRIVIRTVDREPHDAQQ